MRKTRKFIAVAAVLALLVGCIGLGTFMASAKSPTETSAADNTASEHKGRFARPDKSDMRDRRGGKGYHVNVIAVAAQVLGITEDDAKVAIKDGKIGDLLIAAKKVDAFKTAYLAATKEKLDAAVEAGTLTKAQADEKYSEAQNKMNNYDGTQHLCGGKDHSRMFERKSKSRNG